MDINFQYRKIFDEFDIDRSGLITFFEFQKALKKSNPTICQDESALKLVFGLCDTDGSGKINFNEFKKVIDCIKSVDVKTVHGIYTVIFKLLDSDNSGYIEVGEVKKLLELCGVAPGGREINNFMTSIDVNGDGKIELNEFLQLAC